MVTGPVAPRGDADPAEALRAELDQIALTGGGFRRIVDRLAAALGRRVRLVAADGRLLVDSAVPGTDPGLDFVASPEGGLDPQQVVDAFASTGLVRVRCSDGLVADGLPVASGERRVGLVLAAVADGGAGTVAERTLAAATTALAVEAVRRDLLKEAHAETGSWLIGELRFGSRRSPQELTDLARRAGIDLHADHAALALHYDGADRSMWEASLPWLDRPVLVEGAFAWTLVTGDVVAAATYQRDRLAGFVRGGDVVAALGPVVRGAAATRSSFAVAADALALAVGNDPRPPRVYDGMDLEGLLVSVPEERLGAYVDRHLGPLLDHPDLLDTLEAWFVAGGSRAHVAHLVSIHRNSVGYRMNRIRALLGVDATDPLVGRELWAALAARRVLRAVGRTEG